MQGTSNEKTDLRGEPPPATAARGDARSDSDLDLLVIEPEVKSRRAEFVRLREALGNLGVPIDLVVVPASHVDEWAHFEGTMSNDALREGRVLVPT